MIKLFYFLTTLLVFSGCSHSPPRDINNLCEIFREKDNWYDAANESYKKWGVPIHLSMAIMHHESAFKANARPPRPYLLGFIPWFRDSSAYGYAQAQDATWSDYLKDSQSHWWAERDDFADACDFIGWYCSDSSKRLNLSKWDAKNQYLAYHEGQTGYLKKSFNQKPWLKKIALKVDRRARLYRKQLSKCKNEFEGNFWDFW